MKIDRETLYNSYIIKEMSMNEIAKEYNIAVGTVFNYIKKYRDKNQKRFYIKTQTKNQ